MKSTPITLNLERVVEVGPIAFGICEIVLVDVGAHVASVLVTGSMRSPEEARKFQNAVIAMFRKAAASAAPDVLDAQGKPADPGASIQ